MTRRRCTRVWQAEAREDGRLSPADLASFERHAATCEDCSEEIKALRELVRRMASLPEPERTELERRRARSELLRRANERLTGPPNAPNRWTRLTAAGALVVVLAGAILLLSHRGASGRAPTFDVQDAGHAIWSVETNESTSRVTLRSGTAAFQVDHVQSGARFLVDLPDGSIEVRGTRFVVDVEEGQTRKVEVIEGLVLLRLPSFEGLLGAGERWPKEVARAPALEVSPSPSASSAPVMALPAPNATQAAPEQAPAPISRGTQAPSARASAQHASPPLEKDAAAHEDPPSRDAAGPRFAEAMNAFSAGDYGRADRLFAAFVRDFPRDGRAEDATFLRAQASARRGDKAGAAAIAREYLRAFPRGLRRPEAERMAGEQ